MTKKKKDKKPYNKGVSRKVRHRENMLIAKWNREWKDPAFGLTNLKETPPMSISNHIDHDQGAEILESGLSDDQVQGSMDPLDLLIQAESEQEDENNS